jgi:accessory gene regulator protein AgrB
MRNLKLCHKTDSKNELSACRSTNKKIGLSIIIVYLLKLIVLVFVAIKPSYFAR